MQHIKSKSNLFSKVLIQQNRRYTTGNVISNNYLFGDQFGKSHTSKDIFDNKKVVVFGIPGNNPTDDFHQIPSFVKNVDKFYNKGIDNVICLQSADAAILRAKSISLDPLRTIGFLQDKDCKFAVDNALTEDEYLKGLGTESPVHEFKRFALIIDNGRIVFESVEKDPTDYEHTTADVVLKQL
ncbi:hypothetical protein DDB_G0291366 [Dictyostelium discoideum AX4]|uniref:Redoxin domain-containing protein n=1 Tax=Dictyostelium discoideum TaxID=44689 RepID=Q54ES4_DICDI|nr:hypothetical protein DDB_G0291366 [Dictyostelium discoideum AX4]EAL61667.1 hypothetical protein DDB_G0291366 [Dictyostelium discoideum AX4]|eukprot:XP_635166.1 hypothetical protein DDB_G0291366 [Dictyostelium discoideum AX4]